MKCFYCGKEIERQILEGIQTYDFTIIPLDNPYVNIPIHRRECLPLITDMKGYLNTNLDRIHGLIGDRQVIKSNWSKKK